MAISCNQVDIIGYLGQDARMGKMPDGKPVANLSIATTDNWYEGPRDAKNKKSRTEWHTVVIYNPTLCEIAQERGKTGALVTIKNGKLQNRPRRLPSGENITVTEIVVSGPGAKLVIQPPDGVYVGDDE